MWKRLAIAFALALLVGVMPATTISAQVPVTDYLYTTDADFDLGTLVSVNHDAPYNDQLQLDSPTEPFPFINVAASGRGTVVRINTETGEVVGEYRTAPEGRGLNPSRTTVDLFGSVWTANRDEVDLIGETPHGSAVKIGLIAGGTRVDENGTPDPTGEYLAPPFRYSTCVDRDGDGLIRTSAGLLDVLAWPDITDGAGGADGLVEDALDECILIYQRLPNAEQARHVSVDADNNVWVGGFPFDGRMFHKLDGTNGAILDSFDARDFGCGGYGGLVDGNGILWSIGWGEGEGPLLRYDPATGTGMCVDTKGGYGLGVDTNGYVWASIWENGISKVSPEGVLENGYPKSTWPIPSTATSSFAGAGTLPEREPMQALPALMLQADPSLPSFWVAPDDDWVEALDAWSPGSTVALTIEDGSGVLYSDSQTVDAGGHFHFGLWDVFDIQRGHIVTVSDGTTTKTHAVTDLFVDGINVTADTVSGRAAPGTSVEVWVHGDGNLTATADGSGNWTADFSGKTDLTYLSDGGSQQTDTDGDATGVWWAAPRFQVAPQDDWVQSSGNWVPGSTISLTIEDGSGVLYTDSQTADSAGRFNFNLWDVFDIQRGHILTVSNVTTTKTHTVTNLFVDGMDVAADTVFGRADAGTSVDVWVHGDGNVVVTADGSGNWTADFSGMTDLAYTDDGGSQQWDADGDSTGVWWSAPRFQVAPEDDWVQSHSPWASGATISLTIEDGSGVLYTDSQTADTAGNFNFELWDVFDIQRGHVVTVSDGTTTKTHTVMDLYVDGVDVTADTVFGRADAGTDVDVWVHGDGNVVVTADGSGNWTADFSGMTDLAYTDDGGSQQWDADGDSTGVWWSSPSFQANPDLNWVASLNAWSPGNAISLTIEDGSGVLYSDSQMADPSGHFNFDLYGSFLLERGHIVTVSDGTVTKTHTVIELFADTVDVTADTVSGRAPAGTEVNVWVHGEGFNVSATADGLGNWTADFSGMTDLTYMTEGGAEQSDDDGDSTGVEWSTPRFQVNPDEDTVGSWGYWSPGAPIDLSIGGGAFTDSTTADERGEFWFDLRGAFDIQRGDVVTVSDGTTTKAQTVQNLFITDVDVAADLVQGYAEAGSQVEVQVGDESGDAGLTVTANPVTGHWSADFAGTFDIVFGTPVSANQFDDDGDVTWVPWRVPVFQAAPETESLWGSGWAPETSLTVTILGGTPSPYTTAVATNAWGDFGVDLGDFDIATGQEVTITGGGWTKNHVVTAVSVTDIDTAADMVTGTADPGAWVQVNANLFDDWSGRSVLADGSGNWIADFSLPEGDWPAFDITEAHFIEAQEFDEDGDATYRQFGPPIQANRGVAVTPVDNHVWVANSGVGTVTRLDNDGNILKVIDTGTEPTGVAVDAAGKVWVTNLQSNNTVRIDPNGGSDSLGAVDLTVDLGDEAWPYNYSDMTGAVVVGSTSPQGFWTVIQDSGEVGFEWGRLTWNTEPEAYEPPGAEIVVEVRTADTEAGLGGAPFLEALNGELFSSFGRFIEVRVTLKASPEGVSPILSDIRVQPAIIDVPIDVNPTSCPNPFNVDTMGVVPVAILGTDDFDVTRVDPASVTLVGVSPLRWAFEDVATPYEPYVGRTEAYDCNELGADGSMDLTLKFRQKELATALGEVSDGDVVVVGLEGFTHDGIPIHGEDVIVILKNK